MGTKALVEIYIRGSRYSLLDPKNRVNENIMRPGVIGVIRNVTSEPDGVFLVWDVSSDPEIYRILNPDGAAIEWGAFTKKRPALNSQEISMLAEEEQSRHPPSESHNLRFALIIGFPGNISRDAYFVDGVIFNTRSEFVKWRDEFVGVSK